MKYRFFTIMLALFTAIAGCSSPAPDVETTSIPRESAPVRSTEHDSIAPKTLTGEKILEGTWEYECDVLNFNSYTWTSELSFEHANMTVLVNFTDFDLVFDLPLGFRIYSPEPGYELSWLYVETDGTIDPEFTYFNEFGPMEIYPGGYLAFEKELIDMQIDWVTMYQKAKAEFMIMYIAQENKCVPDLMLPDEPAPETLTG